MNLWPSHQSSCATAAQQDSVRTMVTLYAKAWFTEQQPRQRQKGNLYRILYTERVSFRLKMRNKHELGGGWGGGVGNGDGGVGYELSKQEYMSLGGKTQDVWITSLILDWSSNNELHFGNQNISWTWFLVSQSSINTVRNVVMMMMKTRETFQI